ncbi:MAG: transporter substrate-binding domain-containing protein [Deltaproteobacteria bacterium]|nr:transporter substrate-binding domain-containing protein [Deltaproteobacteria bacterium]
MRKSISLFFCILALQLFLPHPVQANKPLRVGVYDNYPMVFLGNDGKIEGFLIDILEYISSKEKWKIDYVPGSLTDCLERLEKQEIDLLVGLEYSRARNRLYDFTYENILSDWGIVYTQKKSDINQIVNLDNKKIAVVHNDIHYNNLRKLAEQFKLQCRFIEAYEYDAILELIAEKRVDAGIVDRLYGLESERYYNVSRSPIILSPADIHFAVPKKKHGELIRTIDKYLAPLKADKRSIYHQSLDKWTPKNAQWALPKWFAPLLTLAGGLIVLFLGTGLILRAQVKGKTAELSLINDELRAEISERRRVEEALRLTQFSVEKAGDAVFWMGSDARFIFVNDAACSSLGYSREELLSMTVHDIDPNFPEVAWQEHWKQIKERGCFIIESRHRSKEGKIFPVEITVNYLEFERKEYNCAFARDISERRDAEMEREKMQAQLRQAQKMEAVGTLAGGIAHDFNNLLQAVQGYAQLLQMRKGEDESDQRELRQIIRAAERGADLTQQLLTFSRKVASELRPIDLNHEVESVKLLLERTIPKMIQMEFHLAKDLKIVEADPGQVEQILMNLAVNAKDAMPEGGKFIVETANVTLDENYCLSHPQARPGGYARLKVSDTGHGMNKETLEHIFEPFYTTKETGKGTGLGLATVYGIVKSHKGHITCRSEPDEGTTFRIYFPTIECEEKIVTREEPLAAAQGGTETILLVDDEEPIRILGSQILKEFGYTVLTAADGESALQLFREENQRIGLVILDLIMPGMGGKRCLSELLKLNHEVRVAIASGYSPDGPTREILKNGAKGFVSKPYDIRQMLNVVREVLDGD